MSRVKVPVFGTIGKAVTIETNPQGLNQAQVALLINNAIQAYARQAVSDAGSNASTVATLWSYIKEVPPNIVQAWHLASSGFIVRETNGDWTTRDILIASDSPLLVVTEPAGEGGDVTIGFVPFPGTSILGNPNYDDEAPSLIRSHGTGSVLHDEGGELVLDSIDSTFIQNFDEAAADAVASLLTDTATIGWDFTSATDIEAHVLPGSLNSTYIDDFNQAAVDAVAALLTATPTISWSFTSATDIEANVVAGSLDPSYIVGFDAEAVVAVSAAVTASSTINWSGLTPSVIGGSLDHTYISDFDTEAGIVAVAAIAAASINDLSDVVISAPAPTDVLTWNGSDWVNAPPSGGSLTLEDLTDVLITVPMPLDVLTWSGAAWVNLPGIAGPTGPTGNTGDPGPPGQDGNDGDDGMSIVGATGAKGATGSTGAKGDPGVMGLPGNDGDDGQDGFSIIGPTGGTGAQGIQGIQGVQGVMGWPGTDGEDGQDSIVPGPIGDRGATGATGSTGGTGPAGPQGLPGNDGDDGQDGFSIIGPTGSTGSQGIQGIQGVQGVMGWPGTDGNDGEDGTSIIGPTGAKGSTGSQGIQGIQGVTGSAGPAGSGGSVQIDCDDPDPPTYHTVDIGISPTWGGVHTFARLATFSGGLTATSATDPIATFTGTGANGNYVGFKTSGTQIGYIGASKEVFGASYLTSDFGILAQTNMYLGGGNLATPGIKIDSSNRVVLTANAGIALTVNAVATQQGVVITMADSVSTGIQIADGGAAGNLMRLSTTNTGCRVQSTATNATVSLYSGASEVFRVGIGSLCYAYGPTNGLTDFTPDTGSFAVTLAGGFTTSPINTTIVWQAIGNWMMLTAQSGRTATSNGTTLTFATLPAACIPASAVSVPCTIYDNTTIVTGYMTIAAGGSTVTFNKTGGVAFTGSGLKGLQAGWTVVYSTA